MELFLYRELGIDDDTSALTRRLRDTIVSPATLDENHHYPNKLTLAGISDKLRQEEQYLSSDELTEERCKVEVCGRTATLCTLDLQQSAVANTFRDEQLEPVWQSFDVLRTTIEFFDSKLPTLTVESAVLPPEEAAAAASTRATDPTPLSTATATSSGSAGVPSVSTHSSRQRPQRKPRPRIECVQEVVTAAENVRSQITQYAKLRREHKNPCVAQAAATAASANKLKEDMERKQHTLLGLLTAVGRIQFDASRLASSPSIYLPPPPLSPMHPSSTAFNNRREFVHAYLSAVSNAIRNALQQRQHITLEELIILLTNPSIALWQNLGCHQ